MSKYKSKKITVDGISFDSKDEAKYYQYLKERKSKGEILNFELQPKYTLIPTFEKNGKKYRAITYTQDFISYHNDGTEELIDIKGFSTQQGDLRRKLFDYMYPDVKLTWIARSLKFAQNEWIEYEELKKIRAKNKKSKEE